MIPFPRSVQPLPASFQSTNWSVILLAADESAEGSRQALEELCCNYWYPLYAFVRRRGRTHSDASDLTQGFFAQILERGSLTNVAPDQGRFRSFLLACMKKFLAGQWRDSKTVRRGGRVCVLSVNDDVFQQRYLREVSDELTPEMLFDRSWAESLLDIVLERLKSDYQRAGKEELFEAIHSYIVAASDRVPYGEISQQLEMSIPAVRVSVHRLRKRYGELLRDEIANTVTNPSDVDDELDRLRAIVARE